MSGIHWCPIGTSSIVAASPVQSPSANVRDHTFDWPSSRRPAHTTWAPSSSAATAELLKNREKTNPLGHSKGPSPQSTPPVPPVKRSESNREIEATCSGAPKDRPPSVEDSSQTSVVGRL